MAAATSLVEGIVQDASIWLAELAGAPSAWLIAPGDAAGGVDVGDLEELQFANSSRHPIAVRVLAVDTISQPNRARVEVVDTSKVMVVPVLEQKLVDGWVRSAHEQVDPIGSELGCLDGTQTTVYQDFEDAFDLAQEKAEEAAPSKLAAPSVPAIEVPAIPAVPTSSSNIFLDDLAKGIQEEWKSTVKDMHDMGKELSGGFSGAFETLGSASKSMLNTSPSGFWTAR